MSSLAPYPTDSPEEARRLELTSHPTTARAQLRWAGPGLRVGELDAAASEGLGPPGRQESEGQVGVGPREQRPRPGVPSSEDAPASG